MQCTFKERFWRATKRSPHRRGERIWLQEEDKYVEKRNISGDLSVAGICGKTNKGEIETTRPCRGKTGLPKRPTYPA